LPPSYPLPIRFSPFFSFTTPAPSPIYTLSLHDALPISNYPLPPSLEALAAFRNDFTIISGLTCDKARPNGDGAGDHARAMSAFLDRKSTCLNSSHRTISYAVFCLKKKKTKIQRHYNKVH